MKHDAETDRRLESRWTLPGSLAAHLLVVALLIFGLPLPSSEPQEGQTIAVDLVPPEPPQEEKAEPPPPPEKPEKRQEAPVEPPGDEAERQPPAPAMLQPVLRFGETDAGPRLAPDGNAAQEGATSHAEERKQAEREPAAPDEPQAMTAARSEEQAAQPETAKPAAPEAPATTEADESPAPEEAGRLASQAATGDIVATTAMNDLPRGVRAGRLCVTELREQLRNAVPPYYPDLLPSYRLGEGTVLDVQRAAFRMNGEWYNLGYRCEVDDAATRVLSFAFRVGSRVPPGEWQSRGLPVR